jgi:hypothetical protein
MCPRRDGTYRDQPFINWTEKEFLLTLRTVGVIGEYNLYSPAKQENTNYNARTINNGNLTYTSPRGD